MTIKELVGRIILYGGIAAAAYYVYDLTYVEPVTRNIVEEDPNANAFTEPESQKNLDDCARYIDADAHKSCIDARSKD